MRENKGKQSPPTTPKRGEGQTNVTDRPGRSEPAGTPSERSGSEKQRPKR